MVKADSSICWVAYDCSTLPLVYALALIFILPSLNKISLSEPQLGYDRVWGPRPFRGAQEHQQGGPGSQSKNARKGEREENDKEKRKRIGTRPSGQWCVLMALENIKRPSALKGNDRIGLMKLFPAFFTKAQKRDWRTDGRTLAHIEMRGRI